MKFDRPEPPSRLARRAAASLVVLLATACASVGAPQRTETLGAADQLVPQPDGTRAWRSADVQRHTRVRIEADAVTFGIGVSINAEEQLLLRQVIASTLRARFADAGWHLADAANDTPVLSLRATITAVERADPATNTFTTLLLLAALSRGSITVEFEALDAMDGRRFAAMAFEGRAGAASLGSAFSALGHARKQASIAATRFAALVAGEQGPVTGVRPLQLSDAARRSAPGAQAWSGRP